MEEINIFLDDEINIYYLNLFDDFIKDENHFKIGNYILNDDNLNITFDSGNNESYKYIKDENNIKYFGEIKNINTEDDNIKIVHQFWEDELILEKNICYRVNNQDKGKFILNNEELNIKWDDYNEEKFKLNKEDNKYYYVDQEKNNKRKILIKNFSWENEIILDKKENKCVRLNETNDKGCYIIEGNYLYINWDEWDNEVFYNIDNIYYNNNKFISNIKIILEDKKQTLDTDKEYLYINNEKYKYTIENKKLIIQEYKYKEFIFLDDEYHYIDYFKYYSIQNKTYLLYNNENIILNHHNIIIAKYNKILDDIIYIEWYNNENNYYKINNDETTINTLSSILLKNESIEKYYQNNNLLYDTSFKNIIKYQQISSDEIILDNNLRYKRDNDIYVIVEECNKKEIILLNNEELSTYYYDNNTLFNSNYRFMCLTDDEYSELYIKMKGKINIYKNLYDNIYITNESHKETSLLNFDPIIFKYFENDLGNDLLGNIYNQNLIYSKHNFNDKYLFLEDINFNFYCDKEYDIFDYYGFFIIQENKMVKNQKNINMTILNFDKNEDFMNNQEKWFDYLETNKENLILIFNDFSYYEFINEIFDFSNIYVNYVILINYSKCEKMIHFYLNKLLKQFQSEFNNINYITDVDASLENIEKQELFVINKDFLKFIYSKMDFIIFVIYFYIKNRNTFIKDNNFSITYNLYQNNTII